MKRSRSICAVVGFLLAFGPAAAQVDRFFKGAAREQAFAYVVRLRDLQARHLKALPALPHVMDTGISLNWDAGRLIFDVMVDVGAPELMLPAAAEGVPVRIVRQPRVIAQDICTAPKTACHADPRTLPVEMGTPATPDRELSWAARCAIHAR